VAAPGENARGLLWEAAFKGETARAWTQMITVTGAKGLASAPNYSPQGHAGRIADGFKKACPESFAARGIGAMTFGDQEAFVTVAGCGKVDGSTGNNTLEFVAGADTGTISGLGSQYVNFGGVTITAGASWRTTGNNTIASGGTLTVASGATLINDGSLVGGAAIALDPSSMLRRADDRGVQLQEFTGVARSSTW